MTASDPKGKRYQKLLARVYDSVVSPCERDFLSGYRGSLIGQACGNVLEVGCGTGANFAYYSSDISLLVATEPSGPMLDRARAKAPSHLPIHFHQVGLLDGALHQLRPEDGFDTIVCTLVLCTVSDPAAAILQMRNLLGRRGKLIVLEHLSDCRPLHQRFQRWVNPLWKRMAGGCNLTRHTDRDLAAAGFSPRAEAYFRKGVPFYAATGSFETPPS